MFRLNKRLTPYPLFHHSAIPAEPPSRRCESIGYRDGEVEVTRFYLSLRFLARLFHYGEHRAVRVYGKFM